MILNKALIDALAKDAIPDPTTRDPAARTLPELPKGFQILSSLQSGTETVYTADQMRAYAEQAIRTDAPALLAEVERLRGQVAMWEQVHASAIETIRMGQQFTGAMADEMRAAGCDVKNDPFRVVNPRAEAAEQVAREAVALVTELRDYVIAARDAELLPRRRANYQPEINRIDDFLAHHGARTGESNEP